MEIKNLFAKAADLAKEHSDKLGLGRRGSGLLGNAGRPTKSSGKKSKAGQRRQRPRSAETPGVSRTHPL